MLEMSTWLGRLGEPVVTGYRSKYFRHSCKSQGCFYDGLPSWDEFIDDFPRKIRPTDIDGVVEINNHFLFLEQKGEGVPVPAGQLLMFKRLAAKPNITVVIFRPCAVGVELMVLPTPHKWEQVTPEDFRARINRWAIRADAKAA